MNQLSNSTSCTADGTSQTKNPLGKLIDKFFNTKVPPAAKSYIINNSSRQDIRSMEDAMNSGMGLGKVLEKYKNDRNFEEIWNQCESKTQQKSKYNQIIEEIVHDLEDAIKCGDVKRIMDFVTIINHYDEIVTNDMREYFINMLCGIERIYSIKIGNISALQYLGSTIFGSDLMAMVLCSNDMMQEYFVLELKKAGVKIDKNMFLSVTSSLMDKELSEVAKKCIS